MNYARLIERLTRCGAINTPARTSQWLRSRVDTSTRRALMDELFPNRHAAAVAAETPSARVQHRAAHHAPPRRQLALA